MLVSSKEIFSRINPLISLSPDVSINKTLSALGMSSDSRLPNPNPDARIFPFGTEQNPSARIFASKAPVGVVRSIGEPFEKTGSPCNKNSVAGAGTGKIPCAHSTVPEPVLTDEHKTRGNPRFSIKIKAPAMSIIESTAPTSWK